MLDTTTKRRIDDCRDILVGKLPDPKAQIEQITIGLIYKFMDDMDKEAVELGGQAKFFTDYTIPDPEFPNDPTKNKLVEFSKYAWDKLMNPKVSAAEMLTLYSEAIEGMEKNPNIPRLFRDIFDNAYLPYRDPETLKLFLKTIGEFEYTHSEKLGDAFEYLLSVMGSQGDAGQFRTPRHIIDFLVAIIDPDKNDTIMDPACGTAGFLIAAYKHILLKYSKGNTKGLNVYQYNLLKDEDKFPLTFDNLTPDDRKKLIHNFVGYDISPDMVRLSLVNLYLHGFSEPKIHEYDTLSSEERWNESFDIILANPPFMSPKGGIRPHKKFTINSNRSEVLFVDYIAEHLNAKGRAGIIVPEGIIFQSGTAYKDLRKMLVENYLYAVVSLPAGVFNPYSGVKTSILLMDKEIAKQQDEILFIKIENDGYNLGAQRTAVKGGQLDEAIQLTHHFAETGELEEATIAHLVPKAEIAKNGDFNLSGERYKTNIVPSSDYMNLKLGELCELFGGGTPSKSEDKYWNDGTIKWLSAKYIDNNGNIIGNELITEEALKSSSSKIVPKDSLIFITRVSVGKYAYTNDNYAINQDLTAVIPIDKTKLSVKYLYCIANKIAEIIDKQAVGIGVRGITRQQLSEIQIPLPPLSIQEEIVAEIEGYQKILDGAKAVVANYKPKIDIDPDWEMVELENIIYDLETGVSVNSESRNIKKGEKGILKTSSVTYGIFSPDEHKAILPEEYERARCNPKKDSIIISRMNTENLVGASAYVNADFADLFLPDRLWQTVITRKDVSVRYIHLIISSEVYRKKISEICGGTSGSMKNISKKNFLSISIPLPNIEIQTQIVAQIEKEQALVNANKQLIEIFEQKIKDRIAKVWGE